MSDQAVPAEFRVRQRQARRRRVRRVLVVVVAIALIVAAVWLIVFSPVFSVCRVQVDGASQVSADDVVVAAAVPMGTPLVRVDTDAVAARVIAALPGVESVSVTRHWPGTLVIRITERVAVYQVKVGELFALVSADGTIFDTSSARRSVLVASVDVSNQDLLRDVATVVLAIPPSLGPSVTSVSAGTRDSITLHLNGGRTVVWGGADQSDLKAQVVVPLLNVPGKVYDVSSPAHPAVR